MADISEWKSGPVDVDQSALVKKALSEYSGPFDVFRELIQNADDANAENIEMHFETDEDGNVFKWIVQDDGNGLTELKQWNRLRIIARGNDSSGKVGTFGVGFYTTLGVCDYPVLISKGRRLRMTLRNEVLEVGPLEEFKTDGWTSVELVLKDGLEKQPLNLQDMARFLVSSITFLEKVNTITVFLADRTPPPLCIKKNLKHDSSINIQEGSPGMMVIKSINLGMQCVSVHAIGQEFLPEPETSSGGNISLAPPGQEPNDMTTPQLSKAEWMVEADYCLYTAQMEPPEKVDEYVRMFVKDLSSDFTCKAVYFRAEQRKIMEENPMRYLFGDLVPQDGCGRVFIGQCTKVRTGTEVHIASKHIIPDMVRTWVRLGPGPVGDWNKSLLKTAGCLAGFIYEQEMNSGDNEELRLYTMQQFMFRQDPDSGAPRHLKSGFLSDRGRRSVLSNSGISSLSPVRRYHKELHSFFGNIPYLHAGLQEQKALIEERWGIPPITPKDIEGQIRSGVLSEENMVQFLHWAVGYWKLADRKDSSFQELCRNGQFNRNQRKIKLEGVKRYTQLTLPKELLPDDTIYISQVQPDTSYLGLFRWQGLDPVNWFTDEYDPKKPFDRRVLTALRGSGGIPVTSLDGWDKVARGLNLYATVLKGMDSKDFNALEDIPLILFPAPHLLAKTPQCLKDCFLRSLLPGDRPYLENILPFIEFGDGTATRTEPPNASDIAQAMVRDPEGFQKWAKDEGYQKELEYIAEEFDSFSSELRELMFKSPILLGRREECKDQLRRGCNILICGDSENFSDFCRSVFVAPNGLQALYKKLGSQPLDGVIEYEPHPAGTVPDDKATPPSTLTGDDVWQCVQIFMNEGPDLEWRSHISTRESLVVKICQGLGLVKRLCPAPGVVSEASTPPRKVTAGLQLDADARITVWISGSNWNKIYTDLATSLCRNLLKTYSGRDVLAIRMLLSTTKENRTILSAPDSGDRKPNAQTAIDGAASRVSKGQLDVHPTLPSATHQTSESPKGFIKSVMQKIDSTLRKAKPFKGSQRLFSVLPAEYDRKDKHCCRVGTDLKEEDNDLKKHDIAFFWAAPVSKPLKKLLVKDLERFADRAARLARAFELAPEKVCIFWNDGDSDLWAYNDYGKGCVYLNFTHYYKEHRKLADEKMIMEWYFIFAHELAHNKSRYHDATHEREFARLCMSRLEAIRNCFKEHPHLGSNL